jgi:hypothetical protein
MILLFFIFSFESIGVDEVGVIFDTWIQNVEEKPYDSGRYFLGVSKKFIKYPRDIQVREFRRGGDVRINFAI